MEDAQPDPTVFASHSLPRDPRLLATVTNVYLGTRVYHDTLHVSGVYNGARGSTHRAVLPSPLNVRLEAPAGKGAQLTQTFALDTNTGCPLRGWLWGAGPSRCCCDQPSRRKAQTWTCTWALSSRASGERGPGPGGVTPEEAITEAQPHLHRYLWGLTLTPEQPGGPRQEVHMLWTPVPPALTLGEGEETRTWDFLTVVGGSRVEAQACLNEALQLQATGSLYAIHMQAWAQFWTGCSLDVAGPLALCQAVRSSFYYLFSALPQPGTSGHVSHGLSPGGLSNGSQRECYWGHVFWDQDLWMFPNILMFHPEAARALLEYRVRTLGGALENARALNYQGAKFAWESAASGLEVCPEDIYGAQEIHINGAVVLAFQLYYHATQDLQFFREAGGWDVVSAVAEFWCSRVEWNPKEKKFDLRGAGLGRRAGRQECGCSWAAHADCCTMCCGGLMCPGVMPPDEYHAGVDNSVYTNVLVQNSLHFAAALARDLGQPFPDKWLVVADGIEVPFDPEQNFHPEFDGYKPGEEVKQADVVLLGYPVPFPLSPDVRRRNLEIYEAVTSPRGPAMTWSMFAVGWMELKDPSRAQSLLDRNITNVTEPFKVWTENADGSGAVNFLTGMGGFLQAVLFGCTGFSSPHRVTCRGVTFDPLCLTDISRVCVSGIFYRGNRLNFTFCKDSVMVEVTAQAWPGAPQLEAELWPSGAQLPLLLGHKVSFPCSAGRIQRSLP
ncbi:protein-glucosylgalactosylhydroxylysine glucosidase isoform X2 [Heterocephalus glaber]|uniref:Protein-glucosylgalactosylhydroxylysine glucosidase isoform X2 n=1 Tax=Heterocephalus glaber TaxID=10181 RepID=A0AAX6TBP9_HETGA|nr:protein-glucosylgalactosylhydroxylysine glucosidase isoform X2 [Heterocephalus glaber]